jgi:type II secretory pathway pseudopilin PulG
MSIARFLLSGPGNDRRPPGRARGSRARCGATLLEIQVAFAVLGISLAGLCPFVVMQLRQVRRLELRLQAQVVNTRTGQVMLPGQTYYLVPWLNPWARKLAGGGQVLTSAANACDPGPLAVPSPAPTAYPVTILQLDATPSSPGVTACVDVSAP